MYPIVRFIKEMVKFRRAPKLSVTQPHISTHMCWPWDLDPWIELNNGRTLTLYDLGRIPMAARTGLVDILRRKGWGITVAGNSTRYRRRIRAFQRFTMISNVIGWDDRFIYIQQSMWTGNTCCNQMLLRAAVTSPDGIVPIPQLLTELDEPTEPQALPAWVQAWIDADAQRPWPPEIPPEAKAALSG